MGKPSMDDAKPTWPAGGRPMRTAAVCGVLLSAGLIIYASFPSFEARVLSARVDAGDDVTVTLDLDISFLGRTLAEVETDHDVAIDGSCDFGPYKADVLARAGSQLSFLVTDGGDTDDVSCDLLASVNVYRSGVWMHAPLDAGSTGLRRLFSIDAASTALSVNPRRLFEDLEGPDVSGMFARLKALYHGAENVSAFVQELIPSVPSEAPEVTVGGLAFEVQGHFAESVAMFLDGAPLYVKADVSYAEKNLGSSATAHVDSVVDVTPGLLSAPMSLTLRVENAKQLALSALVMRHGLNFEMQGESSAMRRLFGASHAVGMKGNAVLVNDQVYWGADADLSSIKVPGLGSLESIGNSVELFGPKGELLVQAVRGEAWKASAFDSSGRVLLQAHAGADEIFAYDETGKLFGAAVTEAEGVHRLRVELPAAGQRRLQRLNGDPAKILKQNIDRLVEAIYELDRIVQELGGESLIPVIEESLGFPLSELSSTVVDGLKNADVSDEEWLQSLQPVSDIIGIDLAEVIADLSGGVVMEETAIFTNDVVPAIEAVTDLAKMVLETPVETAMMGVNWLSAEQIGRTEEGTPFIEFHLDDSAFNYDTLVGTLIFSTSDLPGEGFGVELPEGEDTFRPEMHVVFDDDKRVKVKIGFGEGTKFYQEEGTMEVSIEAGIDLYFPLPSVQLNLHVFTEDGDMPMSVGFQVETTRQESTECGCQDFGSATMKFVQEPENWVLPVYLEGTATKVYDGGKTETDLELDFGFQEMEELGELSGVGGTFKIRDGYTLGDDGEYLEEEGDMDFKLMTVDFTAAWKLSEYGNMVQYDFDLGDMIPIVAIKTSLYYNDAETQDVGFGIDLPTLEYTFHETVDVVMIDMMYSIKDDKITMEQTQKMNFGRMWCDDWNDDGSPNCEDKWVEIVKLLGSIHKEQMDFSLWVEIEDVIGEVLSFELKSPFDEDMTGLFSFDLYAEGIWLHEALAVAPQSSEASAAFFLSTYQPFNCIPHEDGDGEPGWGMSEEQRCERQSCWHIGTEQPKYCDDCWDECGCCDECDECWEDCSNMCDDQDDCEDGWGYWDEDAEQYMQCEQQEADWCEEDDEECWCWHEDCRIMEKVSMPKQVKVKNYLPDELDDDTNTDLRRAVSKAVWDPPMAGVHVMVEFILTPTFGFTAVRVHNSDNWEPSFLQTSTVGLYEAGRRLQDSDPENMGVATRIVLETNGDDSGGNTDLYPLIDMSTSGSHLTDMRSRFVLADPETGDQHRIWDLEVTETVLSLRMNLMGDYKFQFSSKDGVVEFADWAPGAPEPFNEVRLDFNEYSLKASVYAEETKLVIKAMVGEDEIRASLDIQVSPDDDKVEYQLQLAEESVKNGYGWGGELSLYDHESGDTSNIPFSLKGSMPHDYALMLDGNIEGFGNVVVDFNVGEKAAGMRAYVPEIDGGPFSLGAFIWIDGKIPANLIALEEGIASGDTMVGATFFVRDCGSRQDTQEMVALPPEDTRKFPEGKMVKCDGRRPEEPLEEEPEETPVFIELAEEAAGEVGATAMEGASYLLGESYFAGGDESYYYDWGWGDDEEEHMDEEQQAELAAEAAEAAADAGQAVVDVDVAMEFSAEAFEAILDAPAEAVEGFAAGMAATLQLLPGFVRVSATDPDIGAVGTFDLSRRLQEGLTVSYEVAVPPAEVTAMAAQLEATAANPSALAYNVQTAVADAMDEDPETFVVVATVDTGSIAGPDGPIEVTTEEPPPPPVAPADPGSSDSAAVLAALGVAMFL
ncbi:MAG: hypothetical protein CMO44_15745 [Verrucomicrobiales bacterium]|nr:hypothetical protein [Verrucomicrobiales bacterium]